MVKRHNFKRYTDCYFLKSRTSLKQGNHNPRVVWQVFQKHTSILAGIDLIKPILDEADEVLALTDGDVINPLEPVLIIKAKAQDFVEYETVYLGILARCTRVATNVRQVVEAANKKPVLFFPARFDVPETQFYDGYAAAIGGAFGCATQEQVDGFNMATRLKNKQPLAVPVGTMPHALIAAFNGDTANAAINFALAYPNEPVWVLVDFANDCAKTAVEVFKAFQNLNMQDRLAGVRLDTSEKLIDAGLEGYEHQDIPLKGVCPALVFHVRQQLDAAGATAVKICVSGGFNATKVEFFEYNKVPADVYAVGESFLAGSNAFTSDIVARFEGNNLIPAGKVGRTLQTTGRLKMIVGEPITADTVIQ